MFDKAYTCEISFKGPCYKGNNQTRNKFRIDAGKRLNMVMGFVWKLINSEYPKTKNPFSIKAMDI